MKLVENGRERDDRIEREGYEGWRRKSRSWAIFLDWTLSGYALEEIENEIYTVMKDKWEWCSDLTVSVGEMSRIFGRDIHNVRDTMKRMERNGIILMVETRRSTKKQIEKRYVPKGLYQELMADTYDTLRQTPEQVGA